MGIMMRGRERELSGGLFEYKTWSSCNIVLHSL